MATEDDWETLFAKAEGKIVDGANEISDVPSLRKPDRTAFDALDAFIDQRCDGRQAKGPFWSYCELGGSLVDEVACSHWGCQPQQEKEAVPSTNDNRLRMRTPILWSSSQRCRHCAGKPTEHRLRIGVGPVASSDDDLMHLWCALYNLRCVAKLNVLLKPVRAVRRSVIQEEHRSFQTWLRRAGGRDDLTSLEDQCKIVDREVLHLLKATAAGHGKKDPTAISSIDRFEASIRLMIACDEVYYRLYYHTLTGGGAQHRDNLSHPIILPHPTVYFGDILGLASIVTIGSDEGQDREQHPLESMHSYRKQETAELFLTSGWADHSSMQQQTDDALSRTVVTAKMGRTTERTEDFLALHETPAAQVLMEWRNSCRDFLCHLYCYATVSSATIDSLETLLKSQFQIRRIVEVGAGTGYLAWLMEQSGFQVTAYDLHPTDSGTAHPDSPVINEYHGRTPPFCHIQQQRSANSKHVFLTTAQDQALLLCYPPPQSSMALDAVQMYTRRGGRTLIHIGEFKGLTGSAELESYLVKSGQLVGRWPCLHWGTDAAEVTVWRFPPSSNKKRKRTSDLTTAPTTGPACSNLLVPCSSCKSKEATRRFRLCRWLNYCSDECFQRHGHERQEQLRSEMMIQIQNERLDFSKSVYFQML